MQQAHSPATQDKPHVPLARQVMPPVQQGRTAARPANQVLLYVIYTCFVIVSTINIFSYILTFLNIYINILSWRRLAHAFRKLPFIQSRVYNNPKLIYQHIKLYINIISYITTFLVIYHHIMSYINCLMILLYKSWFASISIRTEKLVGW